MNTSKIKEVIGNDHVSKKFLGFLKQNPEFTRVIFEGGYPSNITINSVEYRVVFGHGGPKCSLDKSSELYMVFNHIKPGEEYFLDSVQETIIRDLVRRCDRYHELPNQGEVAYYLTKIFSKEG